MTLKLEQQELISSKVGEALTELESHFKSNKKKLLGELVLFKDYPQNASKELATLKSYCYQPSTYISNLTAEFASEATQYALTLVQAKIDQLSKQILEEQQNQKLQEIASALAPQQPIKKKDNGPRFINAYVRAECFGDYNRLIRFNYDDRRDIAACGTTWVQHNKTSLEEAIEEFTSDRRLRHSLQDRVEIIFQLKPGVDPVLFKNATQNNPAVDVDAMIDSYIVPKKNRTFMFSYKEGHIEYPYANSRLIQGSDEKMVKTSIAPQIQLPGTQKLARKTDGNLDTSSGGRGRSLISRMLDDGGIPTTVMYDVNGLAIFYVALRTMDIQDSRTTLHKHHWVFRSESECMQRYNNQLPKGFQIYRVCGFRSADLIKSYPESDSGQIYVSDQGASNSITVFGPASSVRELPKESVATSLETDPLNGANREDGCCFKICSVM